MGSIVSVTELDLGSLGRYILQCGRDATWTLRSSRSRSRSCGSHPGSVLHMLGIWRRDLTVGTGCRGELVRSAGERERAGRSKRLGLSRIGRMSLNFLHIGGQSPFLKHVLKNRADLNVTDVSLSDSTLQDMSACAREAQAKTLMLHTPALASM